MNKKKKAMVSQPMEGKSGKEIVATHGKAIASLKKYGYDVVDTLPTAELFSKMEELGVVNVQLYLLAKTLENMSLCHTVYFCKGWGMDRSCKIEHEIATAYGRCIIYEE